MATLQDLQAALIAADDSGDQESVRLLSDAIAQVIKTPASAVAAPVSKDRGFFSGAVPSGALMGFADEIQAGMTAQMEQAEKLPWWRKAASVTPLGMVANLAETTANIDATGLITGGAAAASAPGRALAARIAGQGLPGRMATASGVGAGVGAVEGGISGAGYAPTLADVPEQAMTGAAIGGAAGGLLGPAAEAAMSARQIPGVVRRMFDPDYQVARQVGTDIGSAGAAPTVREMQEIQKREMMRRVPGGMLADANEQTRERLEHIANMPGPAREKILRKLTERSRKQAQLMTQTIGRGQKFETLEQLAEIRAKKAKPLYERADRLGVPHTREFEELFNEVEEFIPGAWKEAIRFGRQDLRNQGKDVPLLNPKTDRPTLRGWHYMKMYLDDVIGNKRTEGRKAFQGKTVEGLRSRILEEMDSKSPTYKRARNLWAGTKRFEELMGSADNFMTMKGDEFVNTVKKLSESELEAVRVGAVQSIQDRIEKGQWTHDHSKFFRTVAMEKKMRALFRNPKRFSEFMNRIKVAGEQQRTFDAARGNSATARRLAMQQENEDWVSVLMGTAEAVMTGNPASSSGMINVAKAAAKKAREYGQRVGSKDDVRSAIADVLTEQDPALQAAAIRQMEEALLQAQPQPLQQPLVPGLLGGMIAAPVAGGLLAGQQ
jgi:hypothetical protein